MSIGDNIKALRERFGLTQTQLGEIAGVSDKAVSTWENGANVPRMGAIQKMADYFQIPKSEIIEDKEEKPADQYDELDNILADLLEKIPTKLSESILKLSPQGIDRLLEYAEFLLERESSGSSVK